jgi:hypothetical protein
MQFWVHHTYEKCSQNIYLCLHEDNFTSSKTLWKAEGSLIIFPLTKFSTDTYSGHFYRNMSAQGIYSYLITESKNSDEWSIKHNI